MADQNTFWSVKFTVHFQWDSNQQLANLQKSYLQKITNQILIHISTTVWGCQPKYNKEKTVSAQARLTPSYELQIKQAIVQKLSSNNNNVQAAGKQFNFYQLQPHGSGEMKVWVWSDLFCVKHYTS